MDKAGQKYWDDSWASSNIPEAVNPLDMSINNWVNRRFHQFFVKLFSGTETKKLKLLEVGCAKSAWLPYFSREFGFSVTGLDYSSIGCELARHVLEKSGVEGDIVCADFFSPPVEMLGTFDVVVSFGVVEHFENTTACLRAVSSFLKPGGMLITNIPNMVGWIGSIQKVVNRPVYDIHELINPDMLKIEHERAGLKVAECDYFITTNFGVCNLLGTSTNTINGYLKKSALTTLSRLSKIIWIFEDKLKKLSPNRLTSPYINCISRKL